MVEAASDTLQELGRQLKAAQERFGELEVKRSDALGKRGEVKSKRETAQAMRDQAGSVWNDLPLVRRRSWPTPCLAASLAYQFGLEWVAVRSRSFRFVVIDEAFGRGSDESAQYGLRLFQQLNLQLLIVTPLQKIRIIEPFVASVGFVHNEGARDSRLRCLSIEEYRAHKVTGTAAGMADGATEARAAGDGVAP